MQTKENILTYNEVVSISNTYLLAVVSELFGLEGYEIQRIPAHDGGRNVVYTCEKEGADAKILRIAFLPDRSRKDFLAEVEYIRYLFEHGGSVSDVVSSRKGNLLEEITHNNHTFFVCLFVKAKGKMLVENHYRYREGVPITEYYYNCGKALGKLHQISKGYTPVHRRYSFFDKYNAEYIDKLIPDSLSLLKKKLADLLNTLEELDRNRETYGMIHFDYNDGNYSIDFDTGQLTVYDFDNSCFGWYMYDLADLWRGGVGWTRFEPDAGKRKTFMDAYFKTVLAGYRSETNLEDSMLDQLPLFIQVCVMENIVASFEDMQNSGEEPECDEELSYLIICMEDDIPYYGFFHEIFSCEEPFEYEQRNR
ncbi:phosphotransferase enzyme family protein [Paenibacillus dendritiformis]|uniref:Aminoglycoside phosphotransferase n=1 Tax=Paenibacillus dendritiformis C454 TaxID=1131935 RepID=H3SNU8_9BACL|nr:phosphotransferase [Paenibacillus dendritiformis]EHQ59258.1 aminoglycoside phosphotransferase [Paenibacillus dendritiformis C454]CAH8770836.1 phosphotransferase [Paenibacillus dendritiformis]